MMKRNLIAFYGDNSIQITEDSFKDNFEMHEYLKDAENKFGCIIVPLTNKGLKNLREVLEK